MNLVAVNLGSLLGGHTISAVLFGVFTVQTYIYVKRFAPLNVWTKSVVRLFTRGDGCGSTTKRNSYH